MTPAGFEPAIPASKPAAADPRLTPRGPYFTALNYNVTSKFVVIAIYWFNIRAVNKACESRCHLVLLLGCYCLFVRPVFSYYVAHTISSFAYQIDSNYQWSHSYTGHVLLNICAGFKIPKFQLFRTEEIPVAVYTSVHKCCYVVDRLPRKGSQFVNTRICQNFPFHFPIANFYVYNQHILFAQEYYMSLRHVAVSTCYP
jgi:hypothetical protein